MEARVLTPYREPEVLKPVDNRQIQTTGIKNYQAQVYQKTSNILRAIEQCGCSHCLSILKSGLGNQPKPTDTDDTTIPEPPGNSHV